ncbi:MAG: SufD family Fe-S cluster assembly protein [bacterium]|nr:SufD family Fe-S cluster assembly protein [bacterium]
MNSLPFIFSPLSNTLVINQGVVQKRPRGLVLKHKSNAFHLSFSATELTKPMNVVIFNQNTDLLLDIHWKAFSNQSVNLFWFIPDGVFDNSLSLQADASSKGRMNVIINDQSAELKTLLNITLEEASSVDFALTLIGGSNSFVQHNVYLNGVFASYKGLGLSVNHQAQMLEVKEAVHHQQPNTTSMLTNFLIANDLGYIRYEVIGKINKGNHGSNCKQQNRGVILSDGGSVQVDPLLLIDEYDVEAGHGAAIGDINPDELYYLQSRGLNEAQAKRLIINGYIKPMLDRFEYVPFAQYLEKQIDQIIKGDDLLGESL